MKESKLILFICIISFIYSCNSKEQLLPIDYAKWIENPTNGLKKIKTVQNLEFISQYKPLEYIIVLEEKTRTILSEKVNQRKEKLNKGYRYFNFRIKSKEGNVSPLSWKLNSVQDYQQRLSYLTFDIKDDFYLLEGQDTFKCQLFQFVRNNELAPYLDFVLGFNTKKNREANTAQTFVYNDKIFGIGKIQMFFKKSSIEKTPTLKTSK